MVRSQPIGAAPICATGPPATPWLSRPTATGPVHPLPSRGMAGPVVPIPLPLRPATQHVVAATVTA
jgi:hypothetical protein